MTTSGERQKCNAAIEQTIAELWSGEVRHIPTMRAMLLTALHDAGYAVVPREPTLDQKSKGGFHCIQGVGAVTPPDMAQAAAVYASMIAAADLARADPDDKSTEADDA